jgi:hypothetical protein
LSSTPASATGESATSFFGRVDLDDVVKTTLADLEQLQPGDASPQTVDLGGGRRVRPGGHGRGVFA